MQHSRQWQKSKLYRFLRRAALIPSHLVIIQNYLCMDNCEYVSIKNLAKRSAWSEGKLESLIENYALLIQSKNVTEELLESILQKVNLFLQDYKGAIEIDTWQGAALENYGFDPLTALRYLRFAELIQNKIRIDTQKMLFWDKEDSCIHCQKLQMSIEKNYQDHATDWDKIISVCVTKKCSVKSECKLNPGIISYHMSIKPKLEQAKPVIQTPVPPHLKNMEPTPKANVNQVSKLSKESITVLTFMIKNYPEVSDAKLQAYGTIKNIDIYASLHEINDAFFSAQNREIFEFNNESMVWKVNLHHLSEEAEGDLNTCCAPESNADTTGNA